MNAKRLYVKATPGVKLPIPRSLGGRGGYYPEDKPTRVTSSRFIRRRIAEGSLIECDSLGRAIGARRRPAQAEEPAPDRQDPPATANPDRSGDPDADADPTTPTT